MAFASVNGFRLYYEEAGGGDPVVLIAGLGADAHFWYKQVPALAGRFRVLTFDNRDSNRSDHVDAAYTVADMAGDVKRLTNFTPEYRLRVGDYRALFEIEGNKIIMYRILHRKDAYR